MGLPQTEFLTFFESSFAQRFDERVVWMGGQRVGNLAQLPGVAILRRSGILRSTEQFEIGDRRTDFAGRILVIEYDQKQLSLSNLIKFWPYLRGELSVKPLRPIILCHFSNWWSYGTYRDLWDWTMMRMQIDPGRIVDISGHQFDHGGSDLGLRATGVQASLDWIAEVCECENVKQDKQ